ncbi:SGNH hydrolase superfamily [Sesbania bispinosa]|nr:SGNH hydrolase superfamily [Sesbania bispinosa]
MERLNSSLGRFLVCITLIQFIASISFSTSQSLINETSTTTTKAFFIFGDSTVDSGNNNYIDTTPKNKADYKPYGQNGFFDEPTGRFSDGRVIVDFIAEYAKLPLIPPFLQPSADYSNGVNFASGGAGVLAETNQGLVIDLQTQLRNFEEVRKSLAEKLGENKAKELISEAIYFISIGSNDYMGGYLGNPKMQESYNPEQYIGIVIGNLTQAVQTLYEKGARKFGFLSLSPLGCLPSLRALNPEASKGGCFEAASALALAHNNALSNVLTSLEHILKGFMYSNSNFYDWLQDRINSPTNYVGSLTERMTSHAWRGGDRILGEQRRGEARRRASAANDEVARFCSGSEVLQRWVCKVLRGCGAWRRASAANDEVARFCGGSEVLQRWVCKVLRGGGARRRASTANDEVARFCGSATVVLQ